jgi:hypothetical protein
MSHAKSLLLASGSVKFGKCPTPNRYVGGQKEATLKDVPRQTYILLPYALLTALLAAADPSETPTLGPKLEDVPCQIAVVTFWVALLPASTFQKPQLQIYL